MIFHNPWGLLALLSLPAILALHFFRSRRRVRRVGGLHLWQFAEIRMPIGGKFDRLIRNLPLLLQLLAALLLSLLLAEADLPRESTSRHYTILLNDSVSMQAGSEESAADRAREVLRDWAETKDRFTLIAAGAKPRILAGPFAERPDLLLALHEWKPEAIACDLEGAVNLATKFVLTTEKILLLTDEEAPASLYEEIVEIHALGQPMENVAIDFADRARVEQAKDRVFVTLQSYSGLARDATIRALIDGQVFAERALRLDPGKPFSLSFDTTRIDKAIEVRLGDDVLKADNIVHLEAVQIKSVRVCVVGLPDVAEYFEKAVAAIPYAQMVQETALADLVFTTVADYAPTGRNVRLCLMPQPGEAGTGNLALGRDIVADPRSPVTEAIPLEGVNWSFASLEPNPRAQLLLAHRGQPLLDFVEQRASGPNGAVGRYRLNLLWDRTDIFRAIAWPVLIQGMVEECRQAIPGLSRSNYRVGEEVPLRLRPDPALPAQFVLKRDGAEFDRYDAIPDVLPALPSGRFEMAQAEQALLARFSVNLFAPGESDLRVLSSRKADLSALQPETLRETETNKFLYFAFLMLVIGLAVCSWILQDTSR